jgi:hypothetical protein
VASQVLRSSTTVRRGDLETIQIGNADSLLGLTGMMMTAVEIGAEVTITIE